MHPKLKVISGLASSSWRAALVGALLAVGSSLSAKSLQTSSPFLPPESKSAQSLQEKEAPKQLQSNRFSLRGVSKIGNTYLFSIFDPSTNKSKWIEAGIEVNGLVITEFDPNQNSLRYEWNGIEGELNLLQSHNKKRRIPFSKPLRDTPSPKRASNPELRGPDHDQVQAQVKVRQTRPQDAETQFDGVVQSQKISFTGGSSKPRAQSRISSDNTLPVGQKKQIGGFRSNDSFAQADTSQEDNENPSIESFQNSKTSEPKPQSFSIFPVNRVHNPSGKLPY